MESTQCSKHVFSESGFNYPCQKKVTVERGGKPYCTIHDPEYVKAKDEARRKKWAEEDARRTAQWVEKKELRKLQDTAVAGCKAINPDNPLAVAEAIGEMYEALKFLLDKYWKNQERDDTKGFICCITPEGIPQYWRDARQALAKAEMK
ncbi:hypothetical protein LCGC14_1981640 [marine sediment metagenome]|uniref:Uncharacterized protein n=1 Tax=marine sediment metagenome TaxID=412755 RepID=A0A0F9FX10_9ZZZZ